VTNGVTQAPDTFAQALTRHHIALANPALVEALRNPDKEVRGLAAWQLAETKDKDSLPQILQAVQSEKDARAIVNLASAAAHLGSSEGIAALEAVCHDSSVPDLVRSDAARHLFDQNNRACLPDLWKMMEPGAAPDSRISAISLVSQLQDKTAYETEQVVRFTIYALNDPEIRLRLFAAPTLATMKAKSAIPYLETAIRREREDVVRSQKESSLKRLLEPS
jgi:HEAT repeat protein